MSSLTVRLFGPPRIERDGVALDLDHRKPLALLIYLLVTATPHSRASLAAFFWPDYPNARNYLRNNLSIIRQALGGHYDHWITIERRTVVWRDFENATVDTTEFERHLAAYRVHAHTDELLCPTCVEHLSSAVGQAGDEFLAGFTLRDSPPFDEWSYFHRERLRGEASTAFDALASHHRRADNLELAIDFARSRLVQDEFHEPAHRQLMELYALNGQHTLALRQYSVVERLLRKELDVVPAAETKSLAEAIRQRRYPPVDGLSSTTGHVSGSLVTGQAEIRYAKPPPSPHNNLPAPLNPLIGRKQELADIQAMLADPAVRLITLTGPGGVGKTRLSQAVAMEALSGYPGGVYFVTLARLRSPDLVPLAIAEAAGIHVSPERPIIETLAIAIGAHQMLLVLDNFEHLLAAAPAVTELLQACPSLAVLATSREVLSLMGEHVFDVPPLAIPPTEQAVAAAVIAAEDTVQLFAQRARQADRRFLLDEDSTRIAAHICRRLDGLPLAIELAATRTSHLDLPSLAAQLNGYDDSFYEHGSALDILTGAKRDAPKRHRSLRRAIGWSYDLLSSEEQALFRRLSVFVGGWTLEAADVICVHGLNIDIAVAMHSLAGKHLIVRSDEEVGPQRFSMLETLREFAMEQLYQTDETEVVLESMTGYYLREADRLDTGLMGAQFSNANLLIRQEYPNIRAILERAIAQRNVDVCLRFCATLYFFWNNHPIEADVTAQTVLQFVDSAEPSEGFATLLTVAGYYAFLNGRHAEAYRLFRRGLAMSEMLETPIATYYAGMAMGLSAWYLFYRGEYDHAVSGFRRAIAAAQEAGDAWSTAMQETNLGKMLSLLGRFDEAEVLIVHALKRHRAIGQAWGIAKTLNDGGYLHLLAGRYQTAAQMLEESLNLCEVHHLDSQEAHARELLGLLDTRNANLREAATHFKRTLFLWFRHGGSRLIIERIEMVVELATASGQLSDALRLAGAVDVQRRRLETVISPVTGAHLTRLLADVRNQLGHDASDLAWIGGQTLSLDESASLAMQICDNILAQDHAKSVQ